MARRETEFQAAGEAQLTPREALSLSAARGTQAVPTSREIALACFLAVGEGWDEAARRLHGAFAECPELRTNKD